MVVCILRKKEREEDRLWQDTKGQEQRRIKVACWVGVGYYLEERAVERMKT